jgi:hypothetical protein
MALISSQTMMKMLWSRQQFTSARFFPIKGAGYITDLLSASNSFPTVRELMHLRRPTNKCLLLEGSGVICGFAGDPGTPYRDKVKSGICKKGHCAPASKRSKPAISGEQLRPPRRPGNTSWNRAYKIDCSESSTVGERSYEPNPVLSTEDISDSVKRRH